MIHGIKKPLYMEQIDVLMHDMRVRNVTCQVAPRCIAKVEGRCVLKSDEEDEDYIENLKTKAPKKKAGKTKTKTIRGATRAKEPPKKN